MSVSACDSSLLSRRARSYGSSLIGGAATIAGAARAADDAIAPIGAARRVIDWAMVQASPPAIEAAKAAIISASK